MNSDIRLIRADQVACGIGRVVSRWSLLRICLGCLRPLLSLNGRLDLFEEQNAWVEENSEGDRNDC